MVSFRGYVARVRLLPAPRSRIRFGPVHNEPVGHVREPLCKVVDVIGDACHVAVVDVLRLVRHLMEIDIGTGGEEGDWNANAVVLRVVAATEQARRMSRRIHRVIELHAVVPVGIGSDDDRIKLRRQATRTDHHEEVRIALNSCSRWQ